MELASLISRKEAFKFYLSQQKNYELDIMGHEEDSRLSPAFWNFMEKYLSDTNR